MKRFALIVAGLLVACLLSGCLAVFEGSMQNRITTTLDCKRGFVTSLYGPIGLTSEIDKADVAYLPCAARTSEVKAAPAPLPSTSSK